VGCNNGIYNKKDNIMGLWTKLKASVWGEASINVMNVSTLSKMRREVAIHGASLSSGDIGGIGVRKNVGVVVASDASDDDIQTAMQAFVRAADALELDKRLVPRNNVPIYTAEKLPSCG
jgi:hypothetical protein